MQNILDVLQRQRVAQLHHHREADDLGRRFDVAEGARIAHGVKAIGTRAGHAPIYL